MKVKVYQDSKQLGQAAAKEIAGAIHSAIAEKGCARLLLSTGASQFDTLEALIQEKVDWSKVEMFHLDEYLALPVTHKASFRKYLQERFISKVNLKAAHLVGDSADSIGNLSEEIRKSPIDVGVIGVGENAHIAFNDPPADFDTRDAYIVVDLNDTCKQQQVREGWFATMEDVPKQAISMSVYQIMQCRKIVTCVPYEVKAKAVRDTLENDLTNLIPATMLKQHSDFSMFLDADSASLIDRTKIKPSEKDADFSFEVL